jgi:adhesin/invasin
VNVASAGDVFSTSGISFAGAATYELSFGARMIPQSGTGVYVEPQGVLNAASFAVGYPIAPGSFVALFGSGMGTQTATATALPFPKLLGNVSLTVNGIPAPLYFVSPGFIKFVVPYGVTGLTATIVVTANNVASNAVDIPLAASAPGIFSLPQNGLGDGALRHGNATIISAANPAKIGETIEMYLTGMGGVTPALLDGAPAPLAEPLARVTGPVAVTIGGVPCEVAFSGLTPGLAGLYQLNIKIPAGLVPGSYSLAVQTLEGFTDMVNIWVGQ